MKKAGFSTVEIVVALGVVAALVTMTMFGFTIAQRSSRDSARKAALGDIAIEINNYRRQNLNYPTSVQFNSTAVVIDGQTVKQLTGYLVSGNETTGGATSYFYERSSTGEYALCVMLESGSIESLGTLDCSLTSF